MQKVERRSGVSCKIQGCWWDHVERVEVEPVWIGAVGSIGVNSKYFSGALRDTLTQTREGPTDQESWSTC